MVTKIEHENTSDTISHVMILFHIKVDVELEMSWYS